MCVFVCICCCFYGRIKNHKCGTGTAYKIVPVYQFDWDRLFPWGMDSLLRFKFLYSCAVVDRISSDIMCCTITVH